jgi:hypothetical protein
MRKLLKTISKWYKDHVIGREIMSHHDSQSYSYYQISQRALRDSRRY